MTICNPDGSIYKSSGSLTQLDPNSPTHELFNRWDVETIRLGGTPVLYYELFIPSSSIDPIYLESRAKMWSQHPTQLYAIYDPVPSTFDVGPFGADGPDEVTFYVNYKETLNILGHLPVIGSRLYTPHLRENWEITTRKLGDFHRWKVYRIEIYCKRFQETLTTGEGQVTQDDPAPTPDYNID